MPLDITTFTLVDKPTTLKESLAILERDDYRCVYCGLDGRASFENALVMRVDFVVPRAKKGKKDPNNLVACCGPATQSRARAFTRASITQKSTSWPAARSCAKPGKPSSGGPLQKPRKPKPKEEGRVCSPRPSLLSKLRWDDRQSLMVTVFTSV